MWMYRSSWLHDSGSSWVSFHEEAVTGGGVSWWGKWWCGGAAKKEWCWWWGGGLMLLMFHQLGLPAATICCTGELCTTPWFMASFLNPLFFFTLSSWKIDNQCLLFHFLNFTFLVCLSLSLFLFFLGSSWRGLCTNFSWGSLVHLIKKGKQRKGERETETETEREKRTMNHPWGFENLCLCVLSFFSSFL